MSGPKSSRYTLTPEQRRILAEQRMLERRRAVAKKKINTGTKSLLEIGSLFEDDRQIAESLAERCDDCTLRDKLCELDREIGEVQKLISQTDYNNADNLERTADFVGETLKRTEALSKEIAKESEKSGEKLKKSISRAIDKGFETSFDDIKPKTDTSLEDLRDATVSRLEAMKKNVFVSSERIKEINRAITNAKKITNVAFLKNFNSVTVSPLGRAIEAEVGEYLRCRAEFEPLYDEYKALCELHYFVAQEYACTEDSIVALKQEIERIKAVSAENEEQAYIAECLDEVMRELGYSVIGKREVTKKNGKHFKNELYNFGEGTAVNVTYSSDGRISMELGGIDSSDRLPTEYESEHLCREMESFCGAFSEIEVALRARGVVLAERISILPPSVEYAQIINVSDYKMKTNVSRLEVKRKQIKKAERKVMKNN